MATLTVAFHSRADISATGEISTILPLGLAYTWPGSTAWRECMASQWSQTHRRGSVLLIGCTLMLVTGCSGSGGTSSGFCGRWDAVLADVDNGRINSESELLEAIAPSSLGDPGGELSNLRSAFENSIRNGTNEQALRYTSLITEACDSLG